MTILKHVDGKTVAVKLGNYQSHGNHKRSLLARNLSNPLPPASLFHGNLAWERGGEGYRRERERDRQRKGGRKQARGQVSRWKTTGEVFARPERRPEVKEGVVEQPSVRTRSSSSSGMGSKTRGCARSFSFSFLSFLSFFSIIGPRESFPDFFLFEFEIGKSWNLIWFARNFGHVSRKILDLG